MKRLLPVITAILIFCLTAPALAAMQKPVPVYHWSYISLETLYNKGLIQEKVTPGKSSFTPERIASMIGAAMDKIKTAPAGIGQEELSSMRQLINGYRAQLEQDGYDVSKMKNDLEIYALQAGLTSMGAAGGSASKPLHTTAKAAESINSFTFSLFGSIAAKQDENIFMSPYSISSALSIAYAGARGKTASEMQKVLSIGGYDIHESMSALTKEINSIPAATAKVTATNAIWPAKQEKLLPEYVKDVRKYYGAALNPIDYRADPEKARTTINKWVEKYTGGRIKDIIGKNILERDTPMVLTNAVYFKSDWLEKFDAHNSHYAPFTPKAGKQVSTMMMNRTGEAVKYLKTKDVEMAELPYKDRRFSMLVMLPANTAGLADLEKTISPERIKEWTAAMAPKRVMLMIPKFKMEQSFDLADVLKKMGMESAFTANDSDFSGMNGKRDMFIGNVLHKAFVEVGEAGTEAAAATAVIMVRTSLEPRDESLIEFKADRPFIFLIRDNVTGTVLFIGRYAHP